MIILKNTGFDVSLRVWQQHGQRRFLFRGHHFESPVLRFELGGDLAGEGERVVVKVVDSNLRPPNMNLDRLDWSQFESRCYLTWTL